MPQVFVLIVAWMFSAQVGNFDKSMTGGINGVMIGWYGLAVSTNLNPVTLFPLWQESTGAKIGRLQSKKVR